MKIAVVSDIHLYHWSRTSSGAGARKLLQGIRNSIVENKPDLIIDCGDLEMPEKWSEEVTKICPKTPHLTVAGNHDYYGKKWLGPGRDCHYYEIEGVTIVMTTLWTDFNRNDPMTRTIVGDSMNDYRVIEDFTVEKCYEANQFQLQYLKDECASGEVDIVVTHHSPTYRAVPAKDSSSVFNAGFHSDLDDFVAETGAKYWLFGHTHTPWEGDIGRTKLICHPCGYPSERNTPYLPKYIEI